MEILTERTEIAKALNFGKYPVLMFNLDTGEGSKARIARNDYFVNCTLQKGLEREDDGVFYLSQGATVMSATTSIQDYIEDALFASAPIIEKDQEVAIFVYSKATNRKGVFIMKVGKIDKDCSVVTKFE